LGAEKESYLMHGAKLMKLNLIVGMLALLSMPIEAASAASRVWLSGKGNDGNPCTLQAPCRTLNTALGVVDAGGEIDFLDPAGYGFAYIFKSVSIVNDGVGEVGSQGNGTLPYAITVAAGPNDVVLLRGLTIEGAHTVANGIDFQSGGILTVQNCTVRNFTSFGIWAENSAPSNLQILNSTITDNFRGVNIATKGTGLIRAVIDHSVISNNALNVAVDGVNNSAQSTNITKVTISNSVIAFATGDGVVTTASPQNTNVVLSNNIISNNPGNGVQANNNGGSAVVALSRNTISHNGVGVLNNGYVFSSLDNDIFQNNTDIAGGTFQTAQPH
jgi:hypothetical protein